jgi:hypothetical protein
MQKKIMCTTRYESLFFSFICLINLQIREKSMTFINSCTNNYFATSTMICNIIFRFCDKYDFQIPSIIFNKRFANIFLTTGVKNMYIFSIAMWNGP